MIKANELRIGNWIQHSNKNGSFYLKIDEIKRDGSIVLYSNQEWLLSFEDIDSIPLTPEILEKCGFERCPFKKEKDYYLSIKSQHDMTELIFSKSKLFLIDGENGTIGKEIKSLHQLKNLYFALTGEELPINL